MPEKKDKEKDTIKCQYFTTKRNEIAVTKRKNMWGKQCAMYGTLVWIEPSRHP